MAVGEWLVFRLYQQLSASSFLGRCYDFFDVSPWTCSSPHTRSLHFHLRIFSPFCGRRRPRCSFLCHLCSKLLQSDRQSCQLPRRNLQTNTKQTIKFDTLQTTAAFTLMTSGCRTSWEGAVIERCFFVLRPVKVVVGWRTQHQCEHIVRPQDGPLQHRDLCPQSHLKVRWAVLNLISQILWCQVLMVICRHLPLLLVCPELHKSDTDM